MRFDLQIRSIQSSRRIILPLISTYPRSFGHLEVVIDTGAPKTILSAGDAIRLNVPFSKFQSTAPLIGLGRGTTPVLLINNFPFSLHSNEEESKKFSMPILVVDVPKIRNMSKDFLNNATRIPTLIGIDFLEHTKLKLFIDIKNNIAHLED